MPEYIMQKDLKPNLEETMDGHKGDEMAALERQLVSYADDASIKDSTRRLGFVSAGVESLTDGVPKISANNEDIDLPDESDSDYDDDDDDDGNVEITQKDVPEAVYGGIRKRSLEEEDGGAAKKEDDGPVGALERMKRRRGG